MTRYHQPFALLLVILLSLAPLCCSQTASATHEELNKAVKVDDPTDASLSAVTSSVRHLTLVASTKQPIPSGLEKRFPHIKTIIFEGKFTGPLSPEWSAWTDIEAFYANVTRVSGPLPPGWSAWRKIKKFSVSETKLDGALPPEYAAWTQIKEFDVSYTAISGPLLPQFAAWTQITHFVVQKTEISDPIPPEYAAWTQIMVFDVSFTAVSGPLPPQFAAWTQITHFQASCAECTTVLSGPIPPEYAAWTNIKVFDVSSTAVSGPLPPQFAAWTKITIFFVSYTGLSGPLPPEYAAWANITDFMASNTALSGPLPPEYAAWTQIVTFSVASTAISGLLPPEYAAWTQIMFFYCQDTALRGPLPPQYATWTQIMNFYVSNTTLSGPLPPEYAAWTQIMMFYAYMTALSGPLPPEYAAWTQIMMFYAYMTALSGPLPPEYSAWTMITAFVVSNTALSGPLPPEYAAWTMIKNFLIIDTALSGPMPPEYAAWTQITNIYASNTKIRGPLSPEFAAWTMIKNFLISNTALSGPLPPEYAAWTMITRFDVSSTALSGPLPPEYAAWTLIDEFCVSNTTLNGTLPSNYSAWTQIKKFVVSSSYLHGPLPEQYEAWTLLSEFDVSKTYINSTIPISYGAKWQNIQKVYFQDNLLRGHLPVFNSTDLISVHTSDLFLGDVKNIKVDVFLCDRCFADEKSFLPCAKFIRLNSPDLAGLPQVTCPKTVVVIQDCVMEVTISDHWATSSVPLLQDLIVKRCGISAVPISLWVANVNLDFSGNKLAGNLPEIPNQMVSNRTRIDLSFNSFVGGVPPSWALAMPHVEALDVSFNNLERSLTAEWSSHLRLNTLKLSGNTLIREMGTIPPGLKHLVMSGCAIKTSVEDLFNTRGTELETIDLSNNRIVVYPLGLPKNLKILLMQGNPISNTTRIPKWPPHVHLAYIDVTPTVMSPDTLDAGFLQSNASLVARFSAINKDIFRPDDAVRTFSVLGPKLGEGVMAEDLYKMMMTTDAGKNYYCMVYPVRCPPYQVLPNMVNTSMVSYGPHQCHACESYAPRLAFPPKVSNAGLYPRLAMTFDIDHEPQTLLCDCVGKAHFLWRDNSNAKQYTIHVHPDPLRAENWNHVTFQYSALPNKVLHLPDMTGVFLHGISYTLTIELEEYTHPSKLLTHKIVVTGLRRPLCASNQAGTYGTDRCVACPANAKCNGSTIVLADGNYWRPSEKHAYFARCDDSVQSCTRGDLERFGHECEEGYTGPLCSVCIPGYGKEGNICEPCLSSGMSYFIMALLSFLMIVHYCIMGNLSCHSAPVDPLSPRKAKDSRWKTYLIALRARATPLLRVNKIAMTWFFCLGALGRSATAAQLPAFARQLLVAVEFTATLSPYGTKAFSCLAETPLYTYFQCDIIGYIPISILVVAVIYTLGKLLPQLKKEWPKSAGCIFVCVACMMFTRIIVSVADLLKCETLTFPFFNEEIELANSTNFYHVAKDRRIQCSGDDEYQRFRAGAWAVGAIFGIAGPLACIMYGLRFSTDVFQYLTKGLKPEAWFWELINMFRKAAILAIVTIIPLPGLQLLTYVTFNYFFMMLAMTLRPYDGSRMFNVLECFGTSTMAIIAQLLGLANAFPSEKRMISIFIGIVVFSSVFTFLSTLIFLLRQRPEGFVPPAVADSSGPGPGASDPADKVPIGAAQPTEQKEEEDEEGAEQAPSPGVVLIPGQTA